MKILQLVLTVWLLILMCAVPRAADIKISALPETTTFSNSDVIPIVHGGATDKIKVGNLLTNLESLWINTGGVIAPSGTGQLTNVLRFTSGLADNATNTAVIIDTVNTWTASDQEKLLTFRHHGTNVSYFTQWGAFESGKSVGPIWGPDKTDFIAMTHEPAMGESPLGQLFLKVVDDRSSPTNSSDFRVTLSSGGAGGVIKMINVDSLGGQTFDLSVVSNLLSVALTDSNSRKVDLNVTAADGVTPYIFQTSIAHSSGNLFEFANLSTNKIYGEWDGTFNAGAAHFTVPYPDNATNVALVVDTVNAWTQGFLQTWGTGGNPPVASVASDGTIVSPSIFWSQPSGLGSLRLNDGNGLLVDATSPAIGGTHVYMLSGGVSLPSLSSSSNIVGVGVDTLRATDIHNSSGVFAFGNNALSVSSIYTSGGITAIGDQTLAFAFLTNVFDAMFESGAGYQLMATNVSDIVAIGGQALVQSKIVNSSEILVIGDPTQTIRSYLTNVVGLTAIGFDGPSDAVIADSFRLIYIGDGAGNKDFITNSTDLIAIGHQAFSDAIMDSSGPNIFMGNNVYKGSKLTNSNHNIAIGSDIANNKVYNNLFETIVIGRGQSPTNTHDAIFGSDNNNYFLPGPSLSFSGGGSSETIHWDADGTTHNKAFVVTGTTNQVVFGATNSAPVTSVTPDKWISVQVAGESTVYRTPLYK